MTITRRGLLAATLAAGAAGAAGATSAAGTASAATAGSATRAAGTASAASAATGATAPRAGRPGAATPGPTQLTLPAPTGQYRLGAVHLHLVDRARADPVAGPGRYRELMATIWYPAAPWDAARYPVAPWLGAAPTRALLVSAGFDPDAALAPLTAGHEGAPALRVPERRPVIMFSHGAHDHRSDATIVVQELASHGYVVVTVDHTYDAFVEFPDGRLSVPVDDPGLVPSDFARDVRFTLDCVEAIAAGHNPDVDRRPLPSGLAAAVDVNRVGMFGWSKGGTATALVTAADPRIRAALSLDGPMECQPPITTDIDRPFLMMTADFTRAGDPSAAAFWSDLRGWRLNLQIDGAYESSYCDEQWLLPQMARITGMSADDLRAWIGPLDPARAVKIQQAYPRAFFDLHLRHRRQPLLEGPCPAFPEVRYMP